VAQVSLYHSGLIYFVYWYTNRSPEMLEVRGSLSVLKNDNISAGAGQANYRASVHGTAKNKGNFTAKDIWITYKIEDKEVTAFIGELRPNQVEIFRTGICQTATKKPSVELVNAIYNR